MKTIVITGGSDGLDTKEVVRLIKFIIDTPSNVMIPEAGIKNINN